MSALPHSRPESAGGIGTGLTLRRLYTVRAAIAVLWAIVFFAASSHFSTGTKLLLVLYPAIDIVASLIDARSLTRSESNPLQLVNAGVSTAALIVLAIAVNHDKATVLHVFGAWAIVSGLIQLGVVLRRRSSLGLQPAMLISSGLSVIAGITFNLSATSSKPSVSNLGGYAIAGALFFAISAFLMRTKAEQ